jgi:hypothetical protein
LFHQYLAGSSGSSNRISEYLEWEDVMETSPIVSPISCRQLGVIKSNIRIFGGVGGSMRQAGRLQKKILRMPGQHPLLLHSWNTANVLSAYPQNLRLL